MILETLSEIDETKIQDASNQNVIQFEENRSVKTKSIKPIEEHNKTSYPDSSVSEHVISISTEEQTKLLLALREKALVLFEGLQAIETKDLNTKLDLVINYLQYQVSIIDDILSK